MPIRLCPQCSGLELNCEQGMGRSFIKFWTDALQDKWFLSLSLTEKGAWLMFLLLAKNGTDNGYLYSRSVAHLASLLTGNAKTVVKILSKFEHDEKLIVTNDDGFLTIQIRNYQYWQELRGGSRKTDNGKSTAEVPQKCGTNLPDQTISDSDSDQTRPELLSDKPDHKAIIGYWYQKYEEFYKIKYDFKGAKDGEIIKRLLKVYGYEQMVKLVDALFESTDPFYESGGGRTLGVLSANSNKLAQQLSKPPKDERQENMDLINEVLGDE